LEEIDASNGHLALLDDGSAFPPDRLWEHSNAVPPSGQRLTAETTGVFRAFDAGAPRRRAAR
jgi:hypothetical protein